MKPFLRWAGGKRRLVPDILRVMGVRPDNVQGAVLHEPFLGGGAVALAMAEMGATVRGSDLNAALIGAWELILNGDMERILAHYRLDTATIEDYADNRSRYNTTKNPMHRAALFYWLNRHCFNGLYRENKAGKFNVPAGSHKPVMPDLVEYAHSLGQSIHVTHQPFTSALQFVGKGEMVYCDPPYLSEGSKDFTAYQGEGFGHQDQVTLAEVCETTAHEQDALVVVSNRLTSDIETLYPEEHGWQLVEVAVRHNIAAKASAREKVREVLAVIDRRKPNVRSTP